MNDVLASENERILIIGYGNTLRGDDAVGRKVAETVADWKVPNVRAISVHQLTPELAQDISVCDQVLFVDAFVGGPDGSVELLSIEAGDSVSAMEHATNPRSLLALSRALFGASPAAQWVTVPGIKFDLGEGLSAHAERGVQNAVHLIARLLDIKQCVFDSHCSVWDEAMSIQGARS